MRPLPDLEPAIAAAGRSPDTRSLANLDDRALLHHAAGPEHAAPHRPLDDDAGREERVLDRRPRVDHRRRQLGEVAADRPRPVVEDVDSAAQHVAVGCEIGPRSPEVAPVPLEGEGVGRARLDEALDEIGEVADAVGQARLVEGALATQGVELAEQGHPVIGVELAERAVEDFFNERDVQPQVSQRGAFKVYQAGELQILCGDFFALSHADVAGCQAFYDRAALIALPPPMRERYVAHLQAIVSDACQGLLVTLVYDQAKMDGPPFSVADTEVEQHFADGWTLHKVEEKDVLTGNPRFSDSGLTAVDEHVFRLIRQIGRASCRERV